MKRTAVGIWHCKHCRKTVAGGAWTVATPAGSTTRRYVPCSRLNGCSDVSIIVLLVGCAR